LEIAFSHDLRVFPTASVSIRCSAMLIHGIFQ
jgi:hypothetical protein